MVESPPEARLHRLGIFILLAAACDSAPVDTVVNEAALVPDVSVVVAEPAWMVGELQRDTIVEVRLEGLEPGRQVDVVAGTACEVWAEETCVAAGGARSAVGQGTVRPNGTIVFDWFLPESAPIGARYLEVVGQGARSASVPVWEGYLSPRICHDELDAGDVFDQDGQVGPARACEGVERWVELVLSPHEGVNLLLESHLGDGDVDLELWSGDRTSMLASAWGREARASVQWLNRAGEEVRVWARVYQWEEGGGELGTEFTLSVDRYEPQSCSEDLLSTGEVEGPGTWLDLGLCAEGEVDWMPVWLSAGDTLSVEARFEVAEGDIDLYVVGEMREDPTSDFLAHAWSRDDDEHLFFEASESNWHWIAVVLDRDVGQSHISGTSYDLRVRVNEEGE